MEKFIQPRGTGRTYNICKYAIENDCDIISPTMATARHCVITLADVCDDSNNKWDIVSIENKGAGWEVKIVKRDIENFINIKLYSALSYKQYGNRHRERGSVVFDDIERCMEFMFDERRIKACSIESYDPADVALKGGVSAD